MPKVSTTELIFLGKSRKFEVHYSARDAAFFVKLPPEVISVIPDELHRTTEQAATERAQEIIRKYEAAQGQRRRVIVVHVPEAKNRNWRTNNVSFGAVGLEFAFRVLEEVTVPGQLTHYMGDRGRAEYLPADFVAIPWTKEREAFFADFSDRLLNAREALLAFMQQCALKPELCSFTTLPTLMETNPQ